MSLRGSNKARRGFKEHWNKHSNNDLHHTHSASVPGLPHQESGSTGLSHLGFSGLSETVLQKLQACTKYKTVWAKSCTHIVLCDVSDACLWLTAFVSLSLSLSHFLAKSNFHGREITKILYHSLQCLGDCRIWFKASTKRSTFSFQ